MRTAFPDLEVAPEHMTATEDEVALAYNIPGTTLEGQHRYAEDVRLCLEA